MTTFNQIVDALAKELLRPDFITTGIIPQYLNQTIREVHTGKESKKVLRFNDNRVEIHINNIPEENSYVWPIPRPHLYQATEAVLYPYVDKIARNYPPGTRSYGQVRIEEMYHWYQSGSNLCFFNYGGAGHDIKVSCFYYPRSLVYQPIEKERYATFDVETEEWTYRGDTQFTEEELRDLSANWLTMRWEEMLKEGVRAKVFKRLGDTARAQMCYSSFESAKTDMQVQEEWQWAAMFAK